MQPVDKQAVVLLQRSLTHMIDHKCPEKKKNIIFLLTKYFKTEKMNCYIVDVDSDDHKSFSERNQTNVFFYLSLNSHQEAGMQKVFLDSYIILFLFIYLFILNK